MRLIKGLLFRSSSALRWLGPVSDTPSRFMLKFTAMGDCDGALKVNDGSHQHRNPGEYRVRALSRAVAFPRRRL
jgi:hypothetical protein